jgi:hypothetical protein
VTVFVEGRQLLGHNLGHNSDAESGGRVCTAAA